MPVLGGKRGKGERRRRRLSCHPIPSSAPVFPLSLSTRAAVVWRESSHTARDGMHEERVARRGASGHRVRAMPNADSHTTRRRRRHHGVWRPRGKRTPANGGTHDFTTTTTTTMFVLCHTDVEARR